MENKDEHKKDADAHPHRVAERLVMTKHQLTNGAPENPSWLKLTYSTVELDYKAKNSFGLNIAMGVWGVGRSMVKS